MSSMNPNDYSHLLDLVINKALLGSEKSDLLSVKNNFQYIYKQNGSIEIEEQFLYD